MTRALVRVLQIVLPLAVLAVASFAAITMIQNRPAVVVQQPVVVPPGVRVHEVQWEDVQLSVLSQGTVRPRTESQLVPEISGRVIKVAPSFAEGGFFEQGDVLVTIDPFDYRQAVVSARSQLAQARLHLAQEEAEASVARREWEQLGRGSPGELTLRKPQLEDANAAVDAAEANLERARRDLERADIVAPYAGRVRRKNVDVGQFVTVGNAIATIYAVDVAEIELPLPDVELAYLDIPLSYRGGGNQQGPRVTLRTTFAGRTHEWQGRIVRTESEIDTATRMVHVVAEVQDPYAPGSALNRPPLAVGMYVEAEIEGRRMHDVVVLPRAALRGRNQVLVVGTNNRISFRSLDIVRSTTESILVRGDLMEGDRVTVSALDNPTDGMLVQVTDAGPDVLASGAEPTPALITPEPIEPASKPAPAVASLQSVPTPIGNAVPKATSAKLNPQAIDTDPLSALAHVTVPGTTAPNVLAVIPFNDFRQQQVNVNLGIADAIAERLSDLGEITLASTTSARSATLIIRGSVQNVGDVFRVTARLVDVESGAVLKAIKVDGTTTELAQLRERVATALTRSVQEILASGDDGDETSADVVRRK